LLLGRWERFDRCCEPGGQDFGDVVGPFGDCPVHLFGVVHPSYDVTNRSSTNGTQYRAKPHMF
jgi:hypothetical protein